MNNFIEDIMFFLLGLMLSFLILIVVTNIFNTLLDDEKTVWILDNNVTCYDNIYVYNNCGYTFTNCTDNKTHICSTNIIKIMEED